MAHYHCLLFDVDGTLLDFNASEQAAFYQTMEHFQLPIQEELFLQYREINRSLWEAYERGDMKQDRLVVQRFETFFSKNGFQVNAAQANERYTSFVSQRTDLFEGVADILQELSEVATLAVITNGVERAQKKRLAQAGIEMYFDGIFVSSSMGAAKPSKKIFEGALRSLGVEQKDKVLMIGDSIKADIAGARNAGIASCWCNFSRQAVGVIQPTYTIEHLRELFEIVMEPEELINVGNPEKRHKV